MLPADHRVSVSGSALRKRHSLKFRLEVSALDPGIAGSILSPSSGCNISHQHGLDWQEGQVARGGQKLAGCSVAVGVHGALRFLY